jgi:hypothetical protein
MERSKLPAIAAGLSLWALTLMSTANAQQIVDGRDTATVDAGTDIIIRTNERIHANTSDGRVFGGSVEQDVTDRRGGIIIPKGSDVELIVRDLSNNDFVLDIDSVRINGERYGIPAESDVAEADKRPGEYLRTGEALGAIVGVIAGSQILTRGTTIDVPDDSLLTFRLAEPLREGMADKGYVRNGYHYHRGYGPDRYETQQAFRQKPGAYTSGRGVISIREDHNISWQAAESGNVYVQIDGQEPALFSSGQSGVQPAHWMTQGHLYVFTLQDANGNVIARDQLDLR